MANHPEISQNKGPTALRQTGFVRFIAYMQVICIICVVFGHSFHEYPDGHHGESMLVYRMMYSFRMPSFIFVSGFLMAYTSFLKPGMRSWSRFSVGKVKRLLLPYLVLTLVTFIPRCIMSQAADEPIELSWEGLYKGLFYADTLVIPFFWFVQASFILLVFSYAFVYFSERRHIPLNIYMAVMILLFLLLPYTELRGVGFFSLGLTVKFGIFFAIGMLYAFRMQTVDRWVRWDSPILLVCTVVVWALLFLLTENCDWIIFCQLAGVAMIISISHIIVSRNWRIIDHLLGANYIIFLLSWYMNVFAQQVMSKLVILPWYFYTILSLFAGIYVPYLFYIYLKRHKHLKWVRTVAFMLGQNLDR